MTEGEFALAFEAFRARLNAMPELVQAGMSVGYSRTEAEKLLATYVNEARVGFDLVAPLIRPSMRILEVGCGIGALARFLLDQGFDVVAIEPGSSGFGFMPAIGRAILDFSPAREERWLAIGAEALRPELHGTFDLIYSVNVLEHIPDLDGSLRGMAGVLRSGGRMVHLCPNYFVPYEPHFGIPLLPVRPGLTRHLFPATLNRFPGLWEELNFITGPRLSSLARRNGLAVTFDHGVLSKHLGRFESDPVFKARQGILARSLSTMIRTFGLKHILDVIPGAYLTPMVARMERMP